MTCFNVVCKFLLFIVEYLCSLAKCRLFCSVAVLYTGVRWFTSRPADGTPWLTFLFLLLSFLAARKYQNGSLHTVKNSLFTNAIIWPYVTLRIGNFLKYSVHKQSKSMWTACAPWTSLESGGKEPPILNFGSRWKRWLALQPCFTLGIQSPTPTEHEAGLTARPIWAFWMTEKLLVPAGRKTKIPLLSSM